MLLTLHPIKNGLFMYYVIISHRIEQKNSYNISKNKLKTHLFSLSFNTLLVLLSYS